ncbi:hypothetical protein D3C81_1309870 [compost metagenome]
MAVAAGGGNAGVGEFDAGAVIDPHTVGRSAGRGHADVVAGKRAVGASHAQGVAAGGGGAACATGVDAGAVAQRGLAAILHRHTRCTP